ncbi:TMEM175 family protein [Halorarum halophilum]|uniref:TMEM175 family protein n=1 Tax=Halorarum halophilum TaxID=2743090 RepID=UPI002483736A|nr:TMEM175 family protein [Halobaculum halophilum]
MAPSDGVFAIAITLLVSNVDLPTDTAATVTWAMVGREWRDVFSYVVSFLVIGNFWTDHRRVFEHISRPTRDVTRINLLSLMTVAFLPVPTSLLGDNGGAVPTALYAA